MRWLATGTLHNDRRNFILPFQFYAIMKGTYAGGKYPFLQSPANSIRPTAPADVVFARLPGWDRHRQARLAASPDLDHTDDRFHFSGPSRPVARAALAGIVSSPSLCIHSALCLQLRRGAVST